MADNPQAVVGTDASDWSALAELQPRLLGQIEIHAQQFRGQNWYVLRDCDSGQHLRINTAAHRFIQRLDGKTSLEEILRNPANGSDTNVSPEEAVSILYKLQAFGALGGFVSPDAQALTEQRRQQQRLQQRQRWTNPLAIRVPLCDPDRMLSRWTSEMRLPGSGLLVAAMGTLLLLLVTLTLLNWPSLNDAVRAGATQPHNLLLIWCLYPLLKTVHELAHAVCLKRAGRPVHEIGVTFLIFMPVPYVDASSAWTIRSRGVRMLVSAAGILAELTVACVALVLWLLLEPGLLRDAALILFTIGSLSTLLFNANPLLRFDGYYVLQDYLEIPNLYSRAQEYLRFLVLRFVLRDTQTNRPQLQADERLWLSGYGIAALVYRNLIVVVIAWWLASTLLLPGQLLAMWLLYRQWLRPAVRFGDYLMRSRTEHGSRWTPAVISTLTGMLILTFVLLVPVTQKTRVQGMVWVPDQSQLYAGTHGVVVEVFVQPGEQVTTGKPLLRLENQVLDTRVEVLRAQIEVQELRVLASIAQNNVAEALAQDELDALHAEYRNLESQLDAQIVRAPGAGVFATVGEHQLMGRYFAHGEMIGHVIDREQLLVKVAIPESAIGPIREGVSDVQIRFAEAFDAVIPGKIIRETPSADNRLPGAALGTAGGGGIAIASTGDGKDALHKVFHLDVAVLEKSAVTGVGARAYVSLQHPDASLGSRLLTATRQLFLRHLSGNAA